MYAVIETGGKQYRVEVGTELEVELLDVEPGKTITLDRVLLVADGDTASIGRPVVENASVSAEVVTQTRGPKLISFKYRPKARSRVKKGHRQELTVLRISDIVLGGKSAAEADNKAKAAAKTERQKLADAAARAGRQGRRARREARGRQAGDRSRRPRRPRRPRSRRRPRRTPSRPRRPRPRRRREGDAAKTDREARRRGQGEGGTEDRRPRRPRRDTRLRPRRRRRSPPPPRRTSRRDGTQEGRRQRQERPRQRRPAARRQGRRRPARHRPARSSSASAG